jgi:hypothetical protein
MGTFRSAPSLAGAVIPLPPREYSQEYMSRVVDVLTKIIEQLLRPSQVTGPTLMLTDLPQGTPRLNVDGEVFTKDSSSLVPGDVVLCIVQTQPETLATNFRGGRHVSSIHRGEGEGTVADGGDSNSTPGSEAYIGSPPES